MDNEATPLVVSPGDAHDQPQTPDVITGTRSRVAKAVAGFVVAATLGKSLLFSPPFAALCIPAVLRSSTIAAQKREHR